MPRCSYTRALSDEFKSTAAPCGQAPRPGLQALEGRILLSTDAPDIASTNRAFIDNLIATDGAASPRQQALADRLVAALDRGASRTEVVVQLLRSGLSYQEQVESAYRGLFGRAPTSNESRGALRRLERSGDDRGLKVALLGTREF